MFEENEKYLNLSTDNNSPTVNNQTLKPKQLQKQETIDYTKTSLFSKLTKLEIENSLTKNKQIPFLSKEDFFYSKEANQDYDSIKWKKLNDKFTENTHTINLEKINYLSNSTSVVLSEMVFENSNGHKYHFLDKYLIIDIIGQGSFGIVLKCWCRKSKKKVSVKIISKKNRQKETLKYFEMERKYLVGLNHKNILQIYEVEENNEYVVLILELMEWCTLKQLMIQRFIEKKEFREDEIAKIVKNILAGINYMHMNKVMHRDIKPENIMFKKINDLDSLKIIDLGLATSFDSTKVKKFCGTIKFMAPEILENKSYDQSVDTWACGVIMYMLCSGGRHPIEKHSEINNPASFLKLLREYQINWVFPDCFPL
jgi:tRNA A-37 threonylcarbamoyl transferase component Bud32